MLLVVGIGIAAYLFGAIESVKETIAVARQFVYTAPTANDTAITLPDAVQDDLQKIGRAHQRIALTRVDSTGDISTTVIDMTPRTGDSPKDPVLKVPDRVDKAIGAEIASIEATINTSTATTGDRALYGGLTKIDFTGAPVTIVSSGLDLAHPANFRDLNWSVPAQEVVANVKESAAMPALHGPVTFVVVPTAGAQAQLGQAQKNYRDTVWTALLTAAGATSVTLIDANGTDSSSSTPAPPVPIPDLPDTPIQPVPNPTNPKTATCTLPASYFIADTPKLIDPAKAERDLTPCVQQALAAGATFALDGWTAYDGPLTPEGKPAVDDPGNRELSVDRCEAVADLLENDLGVPRSKITPITGHGNIDQPHPDPRDPANRVVVITYTTK